MNAELFESVRPAAERVGWVLVHSTWEGAAVAAGLWVVLAVIGRAAVRARYAVCCAAMIAVVVAMGVTFVRVEGRPRAVAPAGVSGTPVAVELRGADVPVAIEHVAPAHVERRRPAAPSWDVRRLIAPWLPGVVGAWAAGVMGLAAWHLGGWLKVRRMARAGGAGEWEERVGRIARRIGVSRGVRVVESALAGVPAVVGFVRPVILLPVGLAAEMSVGQVEAILAHELAHVRRNDYLVNLVQTAIETLLFYHPAVWWISGQIRQEREHCCDDLAVAACGGDRAGYARALARVEEYRGTRLSLATAADGGNLVARVRRLAGADARGNPRATSLAAVILAVVCAAAVIALAEWPVHATGRKTATSHPATVQEVPKGQVGVRVTDPSGRIVNVEDIREMALFIPPPEGEGHPLVRWIMGPKPEVVERLPDGGITVDRSLFGRGRHGGEPVEMTFDAGGGVAMSATGTYEAGKVQALRVAGAPAQVAVDVAGGPADVAADEVAGRVVDEDGHPVAGAVASVPRGPAPMPPFVPPVTTDADGVFRFPHFAGHYLYFQVDKEGYARRWLADVPVGHGFVLELGRSTRLKGRLLLPDGKPAAGATITFKTEKPTWRLGTLPRIPASLEVTADAGGRYDVPVEPDVYDALVSAPAAAGGTAHFEHVLAAAGRTTVLPEKLEAGAKLVIRTVDSETGEPVSGVTLGIDEEGAGWMRTKEGSLRESGADGRSSWDGLVPGKIRVSVRKPGYARWWEGEKVQAWDRGIDQIFVDVSRGMPEVTISMEKAVTVTGRVAMLDGTPIDGAEIDWAGQPTGDARYMVHSDKDGRFKITFPASLGKAGERAFVSLCAHDPKWRYPNAVTAKFQASPGMTKVLDVEAGGGARLTGRVVDLAGRPVAKVEVEATATDALDAAYFGPRTLTNADGRFDLGPIRSGVYRVRPDTNYGVNLARDPQGDVKLVEVKDMQDVDLGDIRYTGPQPSLTPEQEAGLMRQLGHGPPIPGGAVSRRPVAPATHPSAAPAPGTGIVPADLVPDVAKAYRLGPTDLVEITVLDPTGPGVKATTSARVSPAGTVRLPLVGEVKLAGLTEVEAVDAIVKAYADKRVIANAQVTVSVTENRGSAFSIAGSGVRHAGQYPVPGPNYRLSEALAAAGAVDKGSTVKLVRGAGKDQRVIEVPAAAVLAGDRGVNVVVRPGDMIVVAGPEQKFVRVVVGKDAITLDGKAVDAAGIERALDAIPPADRPRTTVQVAAVTGDVPVGRFMQVFATCVNKAQALGLPPVSNVGVEPERPTSAPDAAGK